MKFGASDIWPLRTCLLVCVALLATGSLCVIVSNRILAAEQQALSIAQAQDNDAIIALRKIRSAEKALRGNADIFQRIRTRGMLGEESRLESIELLKAIRESRKLINLQYELGPQRPLDAATGSDFSFFVSPMHVRLDLLHEGDLIDFIDDLRTRAKALIHLRSCHMARQIAENPGPAGTELLHADCRIHWITVQKKQKIEGGK